MPKLSLEDDRPFDSLSWKAEKLDSWKEVASFFRREVRTVQLWEKNEGLPIRRQHHKKLGSIYAYRSELERWWIDRSAIRDGRRAVQPQAALPAVQVPEDTVTESAGRIPSERVSCPPSSDRQELAARNELAYHACRMGFHFWSQRSRASIQKAFGYFQDAIELDPRCADAYAGLANTYISLSYNHVMPARQAAAGAAAAVRTALQLEPESVSVRNAWINVLTNCIWDWSTAEAECRRLLDSGLSNARTMQLYSSLMNVQGHHENAISLALHGLRQEPLSAVANIQVSLAYLYSGDSNNALPFIHRALRLAPRYIMGHALLGRIEAERGNWDASVFAFSQAVELSNQSLFANALLAYALAGYGDVSQAKNLLSDLDMQQNKGCYPAYDISAAQSILDRDEEALANIQKAYDIRDMKTIFVRHDPRFARLRNSPAFQQITSSMQFN